MLGDWHKFFNKRALESRLLGGWTIKALLDDKLGWSVSESLSLSSPSCMIGKSKNNTQSCFPLSQPTPWSINTPQRQAYQCNHSIFSKSFFIPSLTMLLQIIWRPCRPIHSCDSRIYYLLLRNPEPYKADRVRIEYEAKTVYRNYRTANPLSPAVDRIS